MAECVVSAVRGVGPACMVHAHPAPCPRNGEPAAAAALHSLTPEVPRDQLVHAWWLRTKGQRGFVLHQPGDGGEHTNQGTCWCSPEIIPASPHPTPNPIAPTE